MSFTVLRGRGLDYISLVDMAPWRSEFWDIYCQYTYMHNAQLHMFICLKFLALTNLCFHALSLIIDQLNRDEHQILAQPPWKKIYETNFNPCQFSKAFQLPNDWNDCLTWEEMKERKRRWPTQSLLLCWQDFFEPAFQISSIFSKTHLFTVAHTVVTLNLFPAGPTGPSTVTFITVSFF